MPFKLSKRERGDEYEEGDQVVYIPIDRTPRSAVGIIDQVLTDETPIQSASPKTRDVTIHATEDEPRYVIRNAKTGKSTAYKRYNIMGEASKEEIKTGHSDFSLDEDTSPHSEPPHHGVPIQ